MGNFLDNLWDGIATLGAMLGGALVLMSFMPGLSAPQAAQTAVQGIAVAAIPYFIAGLNRRAAIAKALRDRRP